MYGVNCVKTVETKFQMAICHIWSNCPSWSLFHFACLPKLGDSAFQLAIESFASLVGEQHYLRVV